MTDPPKQYTLCAANARDSKRRVLVSAADAAAAAAVAATQRRACKRVREKVCGETHLRPSSTRVRGPRKSAAHSRRIVAQPPTTPSPPVAAAAAAVAGQAFTHAPVARHNTHDTHTAVCNRTRHSESATQNLPNSLHHHQPPPPPDPSRSHRSHRIAMCSQRA